MIAFVAVFFFQLRLHRDPARHQPRTADDPVIGWLDAPRGWLDSFGEIARFGVRVAGLVYSGRVLRFFGEACARPAS